MNKPEIIKTLLKSDDEIVEMEIQKIVKKLGDSGYVSVPKELIGEYITISYKKEGDKKP